ncbi:zinc metalloproteinase nas-13-like [Pomacea canaliculata]|uniref:zinc metalloproteinase nas-13-like n=1 Tax=Pomacea canaliculata TaxID=400727 RepID=UPI000D7356FF|nr:zinc metalloproteinase nas-13-like [Pomacea canaliculata]
MTSRGLFLLCLLGAQILASVVSLTMDEIISNAAQTTSEFAFFQSVDSEKPSVKVELDMIFTAEQWEEIQRLNATSTSNSRRNKRKAIRSNDYRWDDDVIPYKIASYVFSSSEEREIQKALDEWQQYTCLSFRRARSTDRNFILFDNGDGCFSNVGMIGGSQVIGLARGCRTKGVIVHEVGHAVGFQHEQTRPDRDDYVEIIRANIPPNLYYNFEKYTTSFVNVFGIPYDYESVMHYGAKAFSVTGGDTIRTKNPKYQSVIGNRSGLSFLDIKMANLMYTCSQKANCRDIRCPSEGFLDKNCKCMCRGNPVRECYGVTPGPDIGKTTETVTRSGTGSVTRPTTGLCEDKYNSCQIWAKKEECSSSTFMMTYCKKSCQKCTDGGQNKICVNMHRYCEDWRKLGHCTGRYQLYMRSNCP